MPEITANLQQELELLRAENTRLKKVLANRQDILWPSRNFLNFIPAGLAFLSAEGTLVVCNERFEALTTATPVREGMQFLDPFTWYGVKSVDELAKSKEVPSFTCKLEHPDGRIIRQRIIPFLNKKDEPSGFMVELIDVTLLEQQRKELLLKETLVQGIAGVSPSFIYLRDMQTGEFLYKNWGPENQGDIPDHLFPELAVHPDDQELFAKFKHAWLNDASETSRTIEYRVVTPEGGVRWMRDQARAFELAENGLPTLLMGTATDVTEFKEQFLQLQDREKFIEGVMQAGPMHVYIYDLERQQNVYANRNMSSIFGYSTEEFRAMPNGVFDIIHPEDEPVIEADFKKIRKAQAGEVFELTYRVKHKEGHWIYIQRFNSPYTYSEAGEVTQVVGVARDVTEFETTKRAKATQEKRFRTIFEQSSEYLMLLDNELQIQELNRTLPGLEKEDLMGCGYRAIFAEFIQTFDEKAKATLQDGQTRHFESHTVNPDGSKTILYHTISRILIGVQPQVLLRCSDITALKEAEQELRKHADLLEASNQELEQFAYVASHDLLEPVRIVGQYLGMIEKRIQNGETQSVGQYMEFALDANQRMEMLIKSLLDFSRVSNQRLSQLDISLDEILTQVERFLSSQISQSSTSIERHTPHEVRVDPILTATLFSNLVSNAIKFSKQDVPPVVRIESRELGNGQIEVSVRDEGIGIAAHLQERIFQVFQRLHPHTQYSGHGIGLTSAKRIAERHGGSIRLESEDGKGTTFFVTLPAAKSSFKD